MSADELAPFVAAVFRDKALAELQEEVKELRQRLELSQKVQVVSQPDNSTQGDGSSIVYSEGLLQHGIRRGSLVSVMLEGRQCLPLHQLLEARICVAGFHKTDLISRELRGRWILGIQGDTDTSKVVSLWGDKIEVFFLIEGWPKTHWEAAIQQHDLNNDINIKQFLVDTVAEEFPEATVVFQMIQLSCDINLAALNNLSEKAIHHMEEISSVEHFVTTRMTNLGDNSEHELFASQRATIIGALNRVYLDYPDWDFNEQALVVDGIIRMHRALRRRRNADEQFEAFVQMLERTVEEQDRAMREEEQEQEEEEEQANDMVVEMQDNNNNDNDLPNANAA